MIQSIATEFKQGGIFMWPILIVLAIACAIVIERLIFYYIICKIDSNKLVADIARALNSDNIEEAKKVVLRRKIPVYVLMKTALQRYSEGMNIEEIHEGVDEIAIKEVPRMPQRLNYLSLFANIATLLGLLGTISGLQSSFSSLASVEAAKKAVMLASGISEAMNTTAFGLMVAIPCMIVYTILYNKQQALTKDLDQAVVRLLNYLKKKRAP